jgi:hypothetical protein
MSYAQKWIVSLLGYVVVARQHESKSFEETDKKADLRIEACSK